MAVDLSVGERFIREVVVNSAEGVLVVAAPGDIVFASETLEDRLGYERDELTGRRITDICPDDSLVDSIRATTDSDGPAVVEGTVRRANGDHTPVRVRLDAVQFDQQQYIALRVRDRATADASGGVDADPDSGGVAPPSALVGVSHDLSSAETVEEVVDAGLAGARRLFGTDTACVKLFDDSSNRLVRTATTERAAELAAARPAFDLDATFAGRAFRRGEPVVGGSVRVDGASREGLHAPVGTYGTVTVYLPPGAGVTDGNVETATLYGHLVTAALARVDPTGRGGERLDGSDGAAGLDEMIRDAIDAILGADTERSIKRRLCECLGAAPVFSQVRVVEATVGGWEVVATCPDGGPVAPQPSALAAIEDAVTTGGTSLAAADADSRSVPGPGVGRETNAGWTAAVPLAYDGQTYGAFVVCGDEGSQSQFTPAVRSALETLGRVAAFATYAAENKRLVLSEERLELEFEVTGTSCLAVPVSEACDCHCEIKHNTLTSDGDHLIYLCAEDADPGTVVETVTAIDSVTECRVVDASGRGCLVEVVKTESGAEAMMDVGATVLEATAEDGVGTLVVEAPTSADAHALAEAYTARNSDAQLVAKRVVDQPVRTPAAARDDVAAELTDKQRAALETAYHAGYYDWPRESTAEDVASSLGVSPPTLHQHLRKAVGTLLERELGR